MGGLRVSDHDLSPETEEPDDPFEQAKLDCADYFASVMTRAFPGVQLEPLTPTAWRLGWRVVLPAQSDYTSLDVELLAFTIRDAMFFQKDILVPYVIERLGDEE